MSSAGISFGGLASGLDTNAIISALVAVERRPISALESKKTSFGKQKSLIGDLGGLLDKLTKAAKALKTTSDFLKMKTASDDETVLTATAGSNATPGTYTVQVQELAKAQINKVGFASATQNLGANGSFQISIGGEDHVIAVGGTDPVTPQSIAAAINQYDADHEIGVRAEVIDTGNTQNGGADRYQLVVRGTEGGSENAFTLTFDEGSTALETAFTSLATNQTDATDAHLIVNGVDVYRSTNSISDLYEGLTLDLKSAKPGTDVTVTVSTDAEETSKKVQSLVDAYNAVVDWVQAQNVVDANGKASSALFGDPTIRSVRSSLRTIVGGVVENSGNEAYQMLSQIGITADTQGKLTFNQSRFAEALADDEGAVSALFTDGAQGIAKRLEDQIDLYTDSVDGLFKSRNDSFDRMVRDTQSRIDSAERRLTRYQQSLEAKYANLETLLTRLQSQGSSIGNLSFSTRK